MFAEMMPHLVLTCWQKSMAVCSEWSKGTLKWRLLAFNPVWFDKYVTKSNKKCCIFLVFLAFNAIITPLFYIPRVKIPSTRAPSPPWSIPNTKENDGDLCCRVSHTCSVRPAFGLRASEILCPFLLSLYHYHVPCRHRTCIFTNTYGLYAFIVFLDVQYTCIYF